MVEVKEVPAPVPQLPAKSFELTALIPSNVSTSWTDHMDPEQIIIYKLDNGMYRFHASEGWIDKNFEFSEFEIKEGSQQPEFVYYQSYSFENHLLFPDEAELKIVSIDQVNRLISGTFYCNHNHGYNQYGDLNEFELNVSFSNISY